jgi:hypothetical protein
MNFNFNNVKPEINNIELSYDLPVLIAKDTSLALNSQSNRPLRSAAVCLHAMAGRSPIAPHVPQNQPVSGIAIAQSTLKTLVATAGEACLEACTGSSGSMRRPPEPAQLKGGGG